MAKWRGLQARWDRSRAYGEGLTIITEAPGSRNEFGEWISGAETRTPVTGATRPTRSGDLDEDTPAGATVQNTRKFSVPLRLSPTTFDRTADRILYDEKEFRVLNAQRRTRPRVTTRVIAQVIEDRSMAPDPILGLTPAVLTLDRAMRRTVADLSGIAREFVIPERDNGPRPQATYATVFETELVRGGIDGTTEFTEAAGSTTTLDARSQLPVAASYRIEFYRDGATGSGAGVLAAYGDGGRRDDRPDKRGCLRRHRRAPAHGRRGR